MHVHEHVTHALTQIVVWTGQPTEGTRAILNTYISVRVNLGVIMTDAQGDHCAQRRYTLGPDGRPLGDTAAQ